MRKKVMTSGSGMSLNYYENLKHIKKNIPE